MRFFAFLLVFTICSGFSDTANAGSKFWAWGWWPSHWDNLDFEPYLQNGKHPHNGQWNERDWEPDYWTEQRSSDLQVLRGFYVSDVIRGQYFKDDVPVLEVGPNFYRLSGYDKTRIAEMFDSVHGITESKEFGMYMLYDWDSKEAIGAYTKHGLQIQ